MNFNSYVFILLFLPLIIIFYYIFNKKKTIYGKLFLILSSFVFYSYGGMYNTLIILLNTCINYFGICIIKKNKNKNSLIIILLINILILFFYKYNNFFTGDSIFLMPLGYSFITFSQVSLIVDVYNGEVESFTIIDYLLYLLFFPKLIQGPIVFYNDYIKQFNDEKHKGINWDNLSKGLMLFSIGLFKKVIIADTFKKAADIGFSIPNIDTINGIIASFSFTMQIYFDFSGYSDMAIGISKMLNINLPLNFDSPYKSLSISEFWNRWHISLNSFLTKYIYIPLGGNRKGIIRTYVNVLIVFVISGIWHGSKMTFVLWGALNGFFVIIDKYIKKKNINLNKIIKWLITFALINIGWIIFRSNSIIDAINMIKNICSFNIQPINYKLLNTLKLEEFDFLLSYLPFIDKNSICVISSIAFIILTIFITFMLDNSNEYCSKLKYNVFNIILCSMLIIWSILSLSGVSTFIYEGF